VFLVVRRCVQPRPSWFLRQTIEQYAREAHHQLSIPIFSMEGFFMSPNSPEYPARQKLIGNAPDHIIPFVQRLEVGNPAPRQASSIALAAFSLQYSQVDGAGRSLGHVRDEALQYQHIVLSHVPTPSDVCLPADPTSAFLEFYGLLSEASKNKAKVLCHIHTFGIYVHVLTQPTSCPNIYISHLVCVVCVVCVMCVGQTRASRCHVDSIEISAVDPGQPILVSLDGTVFGPYYRILIRPHLSEDGSVATLPVSTFVPMPSAASANVMA
jgi:hypothetical protein